MLRQRSYFAGTTAEHLQCPQSLLLRQHFVVGGALARPIFMCLGNASIDRTLISLNPQSLELTSATVTCDCGVTGMHWEQCSLKYRINVQIRFVCLFMSISTAFKFQTRPAMQQTIPAETAEDSRVAERFNYDQSTVLVWIYTAVLLQWTRPADWRFSAFARHRSQHRWVVHTGLVQQTRSWLAHLFNCN